MNMEPKYLLYGASEKELTLFTNRPRRKSIKFTQNTYNAWYKANVRGPLAGTEPIVVVITEPEKYNPEYVEDDIYKINWRVNQINLEDSNVQKLTNPTLKELEEIVNNIIRTG